MPNRYRGCLLGLAVGDALGTTLEFKEPGTFESIADIEGGGPFGLKLASGQTTHRFLSYPMTEAERSTVEESVG
jgi:ADP-ribosylglycohydrolase